MIHDRYSATGTPYPDPETMCKGQCDGMGIYPCEKAELNKYAVNAKGGRLLVVGQKDVEEDGWVWLKCEECCGSRKAEPADEIDFGGHKWKRIV